MSVARDAATKSRFEFDRVFSPDSNQEDVFEGKEEGVC